MLSNRNSRERIKSKTSQ
jgi:hypothetical protein